MNTFELSTNLFPIVNVGMYTNQTCDILLFMSNKDYTGQKINAYTVICNYTMSIKK